MSSGLRWTGAARIITHVTDTTTVPRFTMADRLRKAREQAHLEQGDLADRMEVSRTTIGNYENGRVKPRRIVLRAWAVHTGVSYGWLTTGQEEQPAGYWPLPLAA